MTFPDTSIFHVPLILFFFVLIIFFYFFTVSINIDVSFFTFVHNN